MFFQNAASCRGTSGNRRRRESGRSWFHSKKPEGLVAELRQFQNGRGWELLELLVGIRCDFEEIHQIGEAITRVGLGGFRFARFFKTIPEDPQGRLDFALFPFPGGASE